MFDKYGFADRTNTVVSLLRDLVEIESPTDDKAAVDRLADRVEAELILLDGRVRRIAQTQCGDQLVAEWGEGSSKEAILVMCHMDTVHPLGSLVKMPPVEKDGILFGPGVEDMKAGIAILLTALSRLREVGQWPGRPIKALFTSDEETGSDASRALIESLALQSGLVLCLEPAMPDGSLKTWRKGVGDFELVTRGKAAHAGTDHPVGRNAILEMAHQVLAIEAMTDYEKGTTLNVGVIQGGTRRNVVPSAAHAAIDLRVMDPAEGERITQRLFHLQPVLEGTTVEVSGKMDRPPMPRDARMIQTFQKAQAIAARIGIQLTEGGTGGGSDANFVASLGIPVLDGLGAVGDGGHSEREHILISSLPERSALLAALLTEW